MSGQARNFGGHGERFEMVANSADPKLAYAPKGTLAPRYMTSRSTAAAAVKPEAANPNPGFGYEPHGQEFLWNFANRNLVADKRGNVTSKFFSPVNRKLIVDSVMKLLQEKHGSKLTSQHITEQMADGAMQRAYEIFGETPENAPHAMVGPSESMSYLAPLEKYGQAGFSNIVNPSGPFSTEFQDSALVAKMNLCAAHLIRDGIVGETALLNRYHSDLGGAIHVLEYPSRPGPQFQKGNQIVFSQFDDIHIPAKPLDAQSYAQSYDSHYTGIAGNGATNRPAPVPKFSYAFNSLDAHGNLGPGTQSGPLESQSVQAGPTGFQPTQSDYDAIMNPYNKTKFQ